jgi:hypothetical protein
MQSSDKVTYLWADKAHLGCGVSSRIRYMRLTVLAVVIMPIFLLSGLAFAEGAPAFVKEKLVKSEKIWPGQRLTLQVTLYTTISFSGSTRFELPKVSGMLIMENEDRPLIGSEKIDGISCIFKRHDIILFPLRPGKLQVPSFEVEFSFRSDTGSVANRSFTTRPLKFKALKIPGADPRKPVITTTRLKVDERWQPQPGPAKVGDALVRTITFTADDLPGMVLPPVVPQKIDGLGLYLKAPQLDDQRQRGVFTGRRTETITYVCERQGNFIIPELSFQWWNPEDETLRQVVLKKVEIKVSASPLSGKEGQAGSVQAVPGSFSWKWLALIIPFMGLAIAGFVRFYQKKQCRESLSLDTTEKELWQEFKKAADSHNAAAAMQNLLAWLDHSKIVGTSPTLKHFYDLSGDPELKKEIIFLETSLYAVKPENPWSGDKLSSAVQRARKNLNHRSLLNRPADLPELNPRQ